MMYIPAKISLKQQSNILCLLLLSNFMINSPPSTLFTMCGVLWITESTPFAMPTSRLVYQHRQVCHLEHVIEQHEQRKICAIVYCFVVIHLNSYCDHLQRFLPFCSQKYKYRSLQLSLSEDRISYTNLLTAQFIMVTDISVFVLKNFHYIPANTVKSHPSLQQS